MVKRTPPTDPPPPAPPFPPERSGGSPLRSMGPSTHTYAVPPPREVSIPRNRLDRAYRAGIRKEYIRHAFHAGRHVGRSLIRAHETAVRVRLTQVYSAGDGTLDEPGEEESKYHPNLTFDPWFLLLIEKKIFSVS